MYTDLITKIKNAQAVKKESLKVPYTKITDAISELLAKNKFLDSVDRKGRGPKKIMEIKLKYEEGQGAIKGIKFISKPSRRIYIGYKEIKPIRHGYGISVISTPKGIITNKEAKKEKVGGEVLFEIW